MDEFTKNARRLEQHPQTRRPDRYLISYWPILKELDQAEAYLSTWHQQPKARVTVDELVHLAGKINLCSIPAVDDLLEIKIMLTEQDRAHLRRCVDLAASALATGDQPFGSVLVSVDGEILFEDRNRVAGGDHTQHPEFAIALMSN